MHAAETAERASHQRISVAMIWCPVAGKLHSIRASAHTKWPVCYLVQMPSTDRATLRTNRISLSSKGAHVRRRTVTVTINVIA